MLEKQMHIHKSEQIIDSSALVTWDKFIAALHFADEYFQYLK